jgi:hypothetical protein
MATVSLLILRCAVCSRKSSLIYLGNMLPQIFIFLRYMYFMAVERQNIDKQTNLPFQPIRLPLHTYLLSHWTLINVLFPTHHHSMEYNLDEILLGWIFGLDALKSKYPAQKNLIVIKWNYKATTQYHNSTNTRAGNDVCSLIYVYLLFISKY